MSWTNSEFTKPREIPIPRAAVPDFVFLPHFPISLVKVLSAVLLFLSLVVSAFADGGAVLSQQTSGPYRITLFGSPSPLRAGPADLSVMLQDAKTGKPVLDQSVAIQIQPTADSSSKAWIPPCCSMEARAGSVAATHEAAQNKLLYAANLILPASGIHDVLVQIGENGALVQTRISVQPAAAPVSAYLGYLLFPPLAIIGFTLNQHLRRRK